MTRDAQGAVTGNLLFSSTGYIGLPTGTTVQRPVSASQGWFRFNSTTVTPEVFDGTNWDSIAATVVQPQGYLTLTNLAGGGPILTADVTAATAVYYSPYQGQLCPIYNGTNFVNQIFAEQTLTLASQHTASNLFDVFAFLNSGVFTIGTGPAWTNSGAGTGARGTGAGTTQLQRLNGLYTNQQSMTARNGATTYTVAANQGTYLGSIFIDSSAGQVTCHCSYGQSRKWGVWNTYNRVPLFLKGGDNTATWTYNSNVTRPANNSTANSLTLFSGLAEEIYDLATTAYVGGNLVGAVGNAPSIGIGFNSTTTFSGKNGTYNIQGIAGNTLPFNAQLAANFKARPSLGINTITALENGGNSNTNLWNGTESNMLLSAVWRG